MADPLAQTLPTELLELILDFLSPPEAASAQRVCRAWWHAAEGSLRLRAARGAWLETPTKVTADGTRIWKNAASQFHRGGDRPAIVCANGDQVWYERGRCHREGGQPAVVCADGHREWHKRGEKHRGGDLPAVVCADGGQEWWERGLPHREDNQPAIVRANGTREWWVRGIRPLRYSSQE